MTVTSIETIGRRKGTKHNGPLRMTEQQFIAWADEDTRAEWVDGEVILMSPANMRHVDLTIFLLRLMGEFVEHHQLGKVMGIEFMVRFARPRQRRMPDVLFIAADREHLLRQAHFEGAPDLVMEVVSPDSVDRDWREKSQEYEKAGVREYWVIDPANQRVVAYAREGRRRFRAIDEKDGKIHSTVLKDFFIKPAWLWPEKLPRVRTVLREMGIK